MKGSKSLFTRERLQTLIVPFVSFRNRIIKCFASEKQKIHVTHHATQRNQPLGGNQMPRFGGIATMMRLPHQEGGAKGLNACFVGVPLVTLLKYFPEV